jgi:CRISPR/Cas system-associated exonuclease Cas4 (RecB family)
MSIKKIIDEKKRKQIQAHMPAKSTSAVESELSSADAFTQAFENAWVSDRDTSRSVETDGFHPSSLGIKYGRCARRNAYLLRGVAKKDTHSSRILRVFANGHAVHERLQTMLEKMGLQMESEVVIDYDDPPIKGHCDGVLKWQDKDYIIEIKSCSPEVFVNRLKWKKPKDEHFDQVNIYAYVLGIENIFIIYENKGTQELKVFECKADKAKAEKIIDEWRATYKIFKGDKLPRRPYKPESPVCGACDLKEHCFADPEVGVNIKDYMGDKDAAIE